MAFRYVTMPPIITTAITTATLLLLPTTLFASITNSPSIPSTTTTTTPLEADINVHGNPLQLCSLQPLTGYFRTGFCQTSGEDRASHTVCAEVTRRFLEYTKGRGNDLMRERKEKGDRWCVCAGRWREAMEAGAAPGVVMEATHLSALERAGVTLSEMEVYAIK
ncbi:hypothetical protein BC829DRAFT_370481 [Chytridium lagenaria]|nr:hypothetical protein BC829DRAFT_370481 [Chytridium lagenaria]